MIALALSLSGEGNDTSSRVRFQKGWGVWEVWGVWETVVRWAVVVLGELHKGQQ